VGSLWATLTGSAAGPPGCRFRAAPRPIAPAGAGAGAAPGRAAKGLPCGSRRADLPGLGDSARGPRVEAIRKELTRWCDAALAAPRLAAGVLRRGLLPVAPSALATLRREGGSDLHWKVLGDALVRFLSEAGPILTKLGQVLATRTDLLPEPVCQRLEALYARQRPMPRVALRRALARAYPGRRPFRRFEDQPLAVGSIGQVHRARLRDGTRVVVKLVRPGLAAALRRDLNAARLGLDLFFSLLARDRRAEREVASRLLEELARGLERETDLSQEADALVEFAGRLASNPRVRVPRCFREWSSREVLVVEELEGEPLSALRGRAKSDPEAARRAAELALGEILRQIFDEGRFHADPHAGNLLLLPDGRLGLIDLGLTGELRDRDRRQIARAVRAFLARDADALLRALLEFGRLPADFELEAFRVDVTKVFQEQRARVAARSGGSAAERPELSHLEELVERLFRVARRHRLELPPSTILLIKSLVTIEGVARSLDPEINVVVKAVPIVLRSLAPRWLRWRHRIGSRG